MKLMIPFTPHICYECLISNLKCKDVETWPELNKEYIKKYKNKYGCSSKW